MSFSLDDAIRLQSEKVRRHKTVMNKLMENVKKRIEYHARTVGNDQCIYEVPPFVPGMCLYNIKEAVVHIVDTLLEEGFIVKNQTPNKIWICWNKDAIKEKRKYEEDKSTDELLREQLMNRGKTI